ncbi:MAG: peptide deformylase [Candidatus Pacebacteria bacterium]|nr:peptide deformylase [Candidatus Paceibacterota bacterium]
MVKVLQKGEKVLKETAKEVPLEEISSAKIGNIILQLKDVLENTEDAIALAGPQIGESLRIFVVSKRIFEEDSDNDYRARDLIFINPKIIKQSKEKQWLEEGCLSVRDFYGKVQRCKKVTIRAFDENGKIFSFGASGLLAQVFQHEIDHLNGILFDSKAKNIRKESLAGNKKNPSVI